MPEPPCGKRFQIHLSTAVVMMFVAGALIWANIQKRTDAFEGFRLPLIRVSGEPISIYGWPIEAVSVSYGLGQGRNDEAVWRASYFQNHIVLAVDIALGVVMLFATWFFCERLIRRRAARKGA